MPPKQRGSTYRLSCGRWGLRYFDARGVRRRLSPFSSEDAALAHFREVIEPRLLSERHAAMVWDRADDLVESYDAAFKFEVASGCAWSGELRVTVTNPPSVPSRSATFFSVGGADPEIVVVRLIQDFDAWRAETGIEPMPVPAWMRDGEED